VSKEVTEIHFGDNSVIRGDGTGVINALAYSNATSTTKDQFDALAQEINKTSVAKGFWDGERDMDKFAGKLALIHSEVTEVLEALRKSQGKDKVTEEFADILIRSFDLYAVLVEAGEADPHLYEVTRNKMKVNKERPNKHGNRWG